MGGICFTHIFLLSMFSTPHRHEAFNFCGNSFSPKFKKQLKDHSIKSGQNAVFVCTVANFNPENDVLMWQVWPDVHRREISRRYNVQSREITSNITVYDVGTTNLHLSCSVSYFPRSDEGEIYKSPQKCNDANSATLLVEHFPVQSDLKCSPSNLFEFHDGDVVPIRCEVPRCEPAVDLEWRLAVKSIGHLPLPTMRDVGLTRVLSYNLIIGQEHHLNTIVCAVTSEIAFPSEKIECMIGPIKVLRKPSVNIYPSHVSVSTGDSFQLTCGVRGYPVVANFLWSCSPKDIISGCNSTFKSVVMSVSTNLITLDTNVSVGCIATNTEGSGKSNITVEVLKGASTESGYVVDNINDYVIELSVAQNYSPCCLKLSCSILPNTTNGMIEFQWIINGQSVGREDKAAQQETPTTTSLTLGYRSDLNVHALVTCRSNISGITTEVSKNVSVFPLNSSSKTPIPSILFHTDGTTEHPSLKSSLEDESWPTAVVPSGSVEMKSTTPWLDEIAEQSAMQLPTWKLISLISGVVLMFAIIAVCSVGMTSFFLYRYDRQQSHADPRGNVEATNRVSNSSELSESHVDDLVYELSDVPSISQPTPVGTESVSIDRRHTLNSSDSNYILSSSMSSTSEEYKSTSSAWHTDDNDDVSREYDYGFDDDSINKVTYNNQGVVEMHLLQKRNRSSLPQGQCRKELLEKCRGVPVPPFPKSLTN